MHRGKAHHVLFWIQLRALATMIKRTTFVGISRSSWVIPMNLRARSWVQLGSEQTRCFMITLSPPTHPEIQQFAPSP